jgi:hypothetical protein
MKILCSHTEKYALLFLEILKPIKSNFEFDKNSTIIINSSEDESSEAKILDATTKKLSKKNFKRKVDSNNENYNPVLKKKL